jgi:aminomethyltransferase
MNDKLERTQLYDWHKEHGDVVTFAGWEMPVRYSDIREEHMAVRDSVGIFDTSHIQSFP